MGRHHEPDPDQATTVPILRMPPSRVMRSKERSVAGVAFPIIDDLSLIASDDRLLDSIASGRTEFDDLFLLPAPASSGFADRSDAPNARGLAPLLALWRAQVVDPPLPALPALAVPRRVMLAPADRRRSLRPMLAAGVAICALLMGSTAVGAQSARPGDALWGLTRVLYADHALSLEAQGQAYDLVNQAQYALGKGETAAARSLLTSAQGQLQQVLPTDGLAKLQDAVNGLQDRLQSSETPSVQATLAEQAGKAASSPGRELNAVAPTIVGIVGAGSSSSRPSASGAPVLGPVVPVPTSGGSVTSVASNPILLLAPILSPAPVLTLPPAPPLTSPIAPTTPTSPTAPVSQTTVPVTVTSPISTPPVDPATTAATTTASVTDTTTSVVIAPVTTTPGPTDPATTSSADPATTSSAAPVSTDTSTTSVMPTPGQTDTPTSSPDLSGVVGTQSTVTGP